MIRSSTGFCVFAFLAMLTGFVAMQPARAQTAADLQASIAKVCNVMSGRQKADPQALQLLLLMNDDLGDGNPVAFGIQRGVLHQCPKAYLAFQQRERASNPFAKGSLVGKPVQFVGPAATAAPQDYAMFCRGGPQFASSKGNVMTVKFTGAGHAASGGLSPGQCGFEDRALRASEPTTIVTALNSAKEAANGVKQTNAGGTWTFWVYNVDGKYFNTTVIGKGFLHKKP